MSSAPIRILHVVGGMDCGGVETLLMHVYRRIDRSKIQFDFAVHTKRRCYHDDEIGALGGRIYRHPHPAHTRIWEYANSFLQTLRECGPFTAVHSHVHYFSGLVLTLARASGVRVRIAHSHTTDDGRQRGPFRRAYRGGMQALIRHCATHFLANSRQSSESLYGSGLQHDRRLEIVLNGVDPVICSYASYGRPYLRKLVGLQPDGIWIGHVGGFRSVKNHSFLLDVFAALQTNLPPARLVLVGDGPLRATIKARIQSLGLGSLVHLLGNRVDAALIMAALNLMVFPSIFEGLGNVVIEAQAVGLPCLVSRAVPPEADLGLGLLRFLDIEAGAAKWADESLTAMRVKRPERGHCLSAVRSAGFDIETTVARLERVYEAPAC